MGSKNPLSHRRQAFNDSTVSGCPGALSADRWAPFRCNCASDSQILSCWPPTSGVLQGLATGVARRAMIQIGDRVARVLVGRHTVVPSNSLAILASGSGPGGATPLPRPRRSSAVKKPKCLVWLKLLDAARHPPEPCRVPCATIRRAPRWPPWHHRPRCLALHQTLTSAQSERWPASTCGSNGGAVLQLQVRLTSSSLEMASRSWLITWPYKDSR